MRRGQLAALWTSHFFGGGGGGRTGRQPGFRCSSFSNSGNEAWDGSWVTCHTTIVAHKIIVSYRIIRSLHIHPQLLKTTAAGTTKNTIPLHKGDNLSGKHRVKCQEHRIFAPEALEGIVMVKESTYCLSNFQSTLGEADAQDGMYGVVLLPL